MWYIGWIVQVLTVTPFILVKTVRRLEQHLGEHSTQKHSALLRHSRETGHIIAYDTPSILATDTTELRLYIKETFKIREFAANQSLNGNVGSLELQLW